MKISLIGMSGSGKTYWAKKLKTKGFKHFCCDDLIQEKLGVTDVALWMGQPFDSYYQARSQQYLDFEKEVMEEIYYTLRTISDTGNIVIDTTGSVIYTSNIKKLGELTKVVYLKVPFSVTKEMYKLYLKDPKPVIWGNSFFQKNGETNMDSLRRCYPNLLDYREKKYEEIADTALNYPLLRMDSFGVEEFIKFIK